jgi:hypothetical protein
MTKLVTTIAFAILIASPAFATPVDAVVVGAILCTAIAAVELMRMTMARRHRGATT